MTMTVMRKTFQKVWPRVKSYKSFKHFSNENFRISPENKLSKEVYVNNDVGLETFYETMDTLKLWIP